MFLLLPLALALGAIDREAVVRRHLVQLNGIGQPGIAALKDAPLTLTVGNGVIGQGANSNCPTQPCPGHCSCKMCVCVAVWEWCIWWGMSRILVSPELNMAV